jgi:hypothetical protein
LHSSRAQKSLIFAASAAVTSVFFINFCSLVFQCGCRSLWAGADAFCNIHHATGRHCPWCAHNPYIGYAAMIASQAAISFWPSNAPWALRLGAALAAFPALGGAAALVYGLASGYWKS